MKQTAKNSSSQKENKKVASKKQNSGNKVREDENNSIFKESNNKNDYPYSQIDDKQYDHQPEFIDRNADSKDKS